MSRSGTVRRVSARAEQMYERVHDRAWRLARAGSADEDAAAAVIVKCFAEHAASGAAWKDDLAVLRRIRSCLKASGLHCFADPSEEVLRLAFVAGFDPETIAAVTGRSPGEVQSLVWSSVAARRSSASA